MMKTWSVYGVGGFERMFIEAENAMPTLRICVVSGGVPPTAAWMTLTPDEIPALKTAIDNAIAAMHAPYEYTIKP